MSSYYFCSFLIADLICGRNYESRKFIKYTVNWQELCIIYNIRVDMQVANAHFIDKYFSVQFNIEAVNSKKSNEKLLRFFFLKRVPMEPFHSQNSSVLNFWKYFTWVEKCESNVNYISYIAVCCCKNQIPHIAQKSKCACASACVRACVFEYENDH